jgi:hypothetical protein
MRWADFRSNEAYITVGKNCPTVVEKGKFVGPIKDIQSCHNSEPEFIKKSPGIDSKESIRPTYVVMVTIA